VLQLHVHAHPELLQIELGPVDLYGEKKTFKIYGMDSVTPVELVKEKGEMFFIDDRTKAKRTGDI
jgi:hypothetical protein